MISRDWENGVGVWNTSKSRAQTLARIGNQVSPVAARAPSLAAGREPLPLLDPEPTSIEVLSLVKALGIVLPPTLLSRADHVIE